MWNRSTMWCMAAMVFGFCTSVQAQIIRIPKHMLDDCQLPIPVGRFIETKEPPKALAPAFVGHLPAQLPAKQAVSNAEPVQRVSYSLPAEDDLNAIKLQVLWRAAKEYRTAMATGDMIAADKWGKLLDDALKATSR
ncbi:MAG: hypothetical protein R3B84_23015 [Zavarzinella sp.]